MPTKQELTDLTSKCEWETNTVNGVKGYVVSGKGDYATVSIFLPFAGKALGDALQQPGVEGHGIDVATNAIPGLQLRYATTIDGEFSEEAPLYTNVCEETVWVEASVPGYITTNYSATVKIKSVEEDDPSDALVVGKYFKATLSALGYEVPTNGTSYTVKAYGLPAGLKLKHNAAWKNKKGKVIVKVKSEWWIEGVPTAAIDYITNPAYLVITANGKTETMPLRLEVEALPAWAKGTFNGNVEWRMENGEW
ncbi:MAG: hypothetical protein IKO72_11695, partial [Kiritimatiellae bacterium]|nr:hypothetical protein [Kiritimatiellia bacterium]